MLKCTAHKVTWAHQRKKQRLLHKLSMDVQGVPMKFSIQYLSLPATITSNTDLRFLSFVFRPCTVGSKDGETSLTSKRDMSSAEDLLRKEVEEAIEALCPPCDLHFTCCVTVSALGDTNEGEACRKRRRNEERHIGEGVGDEEVVCVELQWAGGNTSRDQLHQIVQYLRNKMAVTVFNKSKETSHT